jgi:CRISPR-associated protein Cmr6
VGNVQVWGRLAENKEDAIAIEWLHRDYASKQSIQGTSLTGSMGQIGRLWHRMYPIVEIIEGEKKNYRPNGKYLELMTIFPDQSQVCRNFLRFLADSGYFQRLWG